MWVRVQTQGELSYRHNLVRDVQANAQIVRITVHHQPSIRGSGTTARVATKA
eukprot:m.73274 g.73274  ORF g.73274 m.73274 type:complete len:52 (+) comp12364_c0_seq4:237-392(+)